MENIFNSNLLYFNKYESDRMNFDENKLEFIGKKGTLVLVNTFGIHKANIIESGERIVVWNYYDY